MKFSCHERMWEEDHIIGRVAASYTTCMCFSPHLNFRLYVYNCIFNLFSHGMYMSYKKKGKRDDRNINGFNCNYEGLSDYWQLEWLLDL